MDSLTQLLFLASSALMVPVIVALLCALVWSLVEAGGFLAEWRERGAARASWEAFSARLQEAPSAALLRDFFKSSAYPGFLSTFAARGGALLENALHLRKLVADLEIQASHSLSRTTLGSRLGPILGLMGTLIPMGPALVGLSSGDLGGMIQNLVVAFSTTVLGLFVGGLCFALSLLRRRWYAQDLSDVEFICRSLQAEVAK